MTKGKLAENVSQLRLEEAMPGWLVTRWTQHDYGIDAMVETTEPIEGSADRINTGTKFSVQLKSRDGERLQSGALALTTDVMHIRHWLNSTEWVMLTYYDSTSRQLYYRWVDDGLVSELTKRIPTWPVQKTITVHFAQSDLLEPSKLNKINEYVGRRKRITRGHVAPGEFFELKAGLAGVADQLVASAKSSGSTTLVERCAKARSDLEKACYFVAVAGPSRAGKSTLLNVLVGRIVSPVNILPTTAVPMMVLPGSDEEVEVVHLNGQVEKFSLDVNKIEEYVSQAKNQDNQKRVKMLTVRLVNADLERGIAFLDIPGLDDPSPEIVAATENGLRAASAVIYVMDGAAMQHGGFALRRSDVENLKRIGTTADRLFFVVNKCDTITEDQRVTLKEYLAREFKKYGIDKVVPVEPILLSAKDAEIARRNGAHDTVEHLEAALWDFLINKQKTGLDLLLATGANIGALIEELDSILRAQIITISEVKVIRGRLEVARERAGTIAMQMESERQRILAYSSNRLFHHKNVILDNLQQALESLPRDQAMYTDADVKHYLEEHAKRAFVQEAEALQGDLGAAAHLASRTATEILQDVQKGLKGGDRAIEVPIAPLMLEELEPPPSFGWIFWGLAGGIIGAFVGPAEAGILAILGMFGNLLMSAEQRRSKKIAHLMRVARAKYDTAFSRAEKIFAARANEGISTITSDVRGRVMLFAADLIGQLSRRKVELSTEDVARVRTIIDETGREREALRPLMSQLRRLVY